ncbi:MAG TPA: triose-phosphate isomerase [Phycisphaerales bacterium]|nr:triose-phosphate isomerase [Phycisphaerales bacterium]
MRKPFIAGNWKMNTNGESANALAAGLAKEIGDIDTVDVAVCPPYIYLQAVATQLSSSNIAMGSQNVYFEASGAYTGEISCDMLKDVSCTYAIIGHSERRHVIGETDELINQKVSVAISSGLLPILCVGELLEEREAEKTDDVVTNQIKKGLAGIDAEKVLAVTIAYEPVWAIGTGLTATSDQAQQVHAMIRKLLAEMYDESVAAQIRIQYGGSAKPENTAELMACPDVDGLLVGGAALKVDSFAAMIKTIA